MFSSVDAPPKSKKKTVPFNVSGGGDFAGSPSSEAGEDAAAVGHAPENAGQKVRERSKYEAAEPFRSKKGDRFS